MHHFIRFAMPVALAAGLAACQPRVYETARPVEPRPARAAIEGEWVDPNGIISSFRGGTFETRTTDTGDLLATGNYRYVTPRMVEIDLRSLLRQTNSRVNCAVVSLSQLNCTSSDGAQFSLTRTA